MRVIKFRAYCKPVAYMKYDIQKDSTFYTRIKDKQHDVMEYTGLNDKNNNEIYEGDILKWSGVDDITQEEMTTIGVVLFQEGCFKVKDEYSVSLLSNWTNSEVIGNVYEDEELAEGIKL